MAGTRRNGYRNNKYQYLDDDDEDIELCTCQHFDLYVKCGRVSFRVWYTP